MSAPTDNSRVTIYAARLCNNVRQTTSPGKPYKLTDNNKSVKLAERVANDFQSYKNALHSKPNNNTYFGMRKIGTHKMPSDQQFAKGYKPNPINPKHLLAPYTENELNRQKLSKKFGQWPPRKYNVLRRHGNNLRAVNVNNNQKTSLGTIEFNNGTPIQHEPVHCDIPHQGAIEKLHTDSSVPFSEPLLPTSFVPYDPKMKTIKDGDSYFVYADEVDNRLKDVSEASNQSSPIHIPTNTVEEEVEEDLFKEFFYTSDQKTVASVAFGNDVLCEMSDVVGIDDETGMQQLFEQNPDILSITDEILDIDISELEHFLQLEPQVSTIHKQLGKSKVSSSRKIDNSINKVVELMADPTSEVLTHRKNGNYPLVNRAPNPRHFVKTLPESTRTNICDIEQVEGVPQSSSSYYDDISFDGPTNHQILDHPYFHTDHSTLDFPF